MTMSDVARAADLIIFDHKYEEADDYVRSQIKRRVGK